MFSGFMLDTWVAATAVAIVAGAVGFFVVIRGSAFAAHAVPHGAFGGAAGAALIGLNTIVGLFVFAVGGALGIGWLSRRGRHDVATALSLVLMLALGALFLSFSTQYAPEIYSLLFGEVLGVSAAQLPPIFGLGAICIAAIAVFYRPLLMTALMPEVGEARGIRLQRIDTGFLLVVALATTMTVPVVGVLLMYSLMIGPAATARSLTNSPASAIAVSVGIALCIVWVAIASSYATNWPIGFFVGAGGAVAYAAGRGFNAWRGRRPGESARLLSPAAVSSET
jgi:zinc/manganese transport system permease protein